MVLSTHLHLLLSVESQEDLSNLMRDFESKTAREVNRWVGAGARLLLCHLLHVLVRVPSFNFDEFPQK